MKLSDLTTDRAADVLCEISIYLVNITTDERTEKAVTANRSRNYI